MSEELTVLKEYIDSLGFEPSKMTDEDLNTLRCELVEAGEYGLASLVRSLRGPGELLEYVGTEEE